MFYKDSIDTNQLHSIDEIIDNKSNATQVVDMIIHSQEPSRFGVSDECVLENIGAIRVCLFKDTNSDELLITPDLLEVIIDNVYEGENGALVYDSFRKIVSLKELNDALKERGFKLAANTMVQVIPLLEGEEADIKVVKHEKSKQLVRM